MDPPSSVFIKSDSATPKFIINRLITFSYSRQPRRETTTVVSCVEALADVPSVPAVGYRAPQCTAVAVPPLGGTRVASARGPFRAQHDRASSAAAAVRLRARSAAVAAGSVISLSSFTALRQR